jgi:putative transposase
LVIPDVAVHIVQRGHDRGDCFFHEADYRAYLAAVREYAAEFRCAVHAYCLMTNHVQLLLTPGDPTGCAQLMKHVAQRHSKRMNALHGRTGTLWEGRFYSGLVPTEHYALACYRYIDLNPVNGGLVSHASEYRWSSCGANACARLDSLLNPHPAYVTLAADPAARAALYAELCGSPLAQSDLDEIRKATRSGQSMGAARRRRGRPQKMVTVTI